MPSEKQKPVERILSAKQRDASACTSALARRAEAVPANNDFLLVSQKRGWARRELQTRVCRKCQATKPRDQFAPADTLCVTCRAAPRPVQRERERLLVQRLKVGAICSATKLVDQSYGGFQCRPRLGLKP